MKFRFLEQFFSTRYSTLFKRSSFRIHFQLLVKQVHWTQRSDPVSLEFSDANCLVRWSRWMTGQLEP